MNEAAKSLSPDALRARAKEFRSVPDHREHRWVNLGIQLSQIERDVRKRRIPLGESLTAEEPENTAYADYLADLRSALEVVQDALREDETDFRLRAAKSIFDLKEVSDGDGEANYQRV